MQGRAALDRVFMLFDVRNTILDGPISVERVRGAIAFEQVCFAYPDGYVALSDVNLTITPGTRVAFVGRSGAGKSTVFNLLPRLYDPTGGRILIDGTDIRELTLASLRDQIAVVSQDSVLRSRGRWPTSRSGRARRWPRTGPIRSRRPSWRWTRTRARSARWSAGGTSPRAASTVPPRRSGSPGRPSSRSSMPWPSSRG
jgi:hypothetical protein